MIMKQRGFSSPPCLNCRLSQTTLWIKKVKLIIWGVQVTDCCGKSVISVFIHFVYWVTFVRKHTEISCQSLKNAFVSRLCFTDARRLWSMNIETVHARLRCSRRQQTAWKSKQKEKEMLALCCHPGLVAHCSMFAWYSHPQRRRSVKFVLAWPFHSPGTFTAPQYISKHRLSPSAVHSCIIVSTLPHPQFSACFFWGYFKYCLSLTLFGELQQQ